MHRRVVHLVVTIALVAIAACSGGGDDDNTSSTSITRESSTTNTTNGATSSTARSTTTTVPPRPDLAAAKITLTQITNKLDSPVAFATRPGDKRFYVVEQGGDIVIVDGSRVLPRKVLTVSVSRDNEQGLLGLVFSSDGKKLYVDYTDPSGDTHVDEYTMNGDVADTSTKRQLLFVDQPYANHNGGEVTFGPDGMLYITFGDGGSAGDPQNRAQNLGTLLGKILRIDPTPSGSAPYTIPPDNPFVGRAGARPEIWMYGLRNPWRFSFDRANRDVWIGDVGQGDWEEIDYTPLANAAGSNWGWSLREGTHRFKGAPPPGAREPIFELSHTDGNCAVTGGYVYRGTKIAPLRGAYVFADYCRGELLGLVQQNGQRVDERALGPRTSSVTSFGEGTDGELYVLTRFGFLYRIDPA
jgi:glucose/arabinose dehydrogenase